MGGNGFDGGGGGFKKIVGLGAAPTMPSPPYGKPLTAKLHHDI